MPDPITKFERAAEDMLGAGHVAAAGFGRAAIWIGLRALEVAGRDVLLPDFICAQVTDAVRATRARPVFYRVGRDLRVFVEDLRKAVTPASRAVVVVHYFGVMQPEIETLADFCRTNSVLLLEDCAQALGAENAGSKAGAFGDMAFFSLTKSDWCDGGGFVAARGADLMQRIRQIAGENLQEAPSLLRWYGRLRRLDFLANCVRWSDAAGRAGRFMESCARFSEGNFFDAGRMNVRMSHRAAERGISILQGLAANIRTRRQIIQEIFERLGGVAPRVHLPGWDAQLLRGGTGAFLPICCGGGNAAQWREEANNMRVTLRPVWPAYQDFAAGQASEDLQWLSRNLLYLEIHPRLRPAEIRRIAILIHRLTGRAGLAR